VNGTETELAAKYIQSPIARIAWNPEALNVPEAWRAPFGLMQAQISSKRQPLPYLRGRQIPDRLPSMVLTSLQYIQPPPMGFHAWCADPSTTAACLVEGSKSRPAAAVSCLHDFQTSRLSAVGWLEKRAREPTEAVWQVLNCDKRPAGAAGSI
jgi:hypothetical protein